MGNTCYRCCSCCLGKYRTRKYLRTRYNVERDISIEFENLMDEDTAQQEELNRYNGLTNTERYLLLNKQYGSLIEEQIKTDASIDQQLVRQEEELRAEEEAYYEARREAARAEAKAKALETKLRQKDAALSGDKKWVGEGDEWDINGVEEDFELFLDAVKARSLAARTRSLPSQVPIDEQSSSSLTSKDKTDDANSSLDLEWEHEAGMQPFPKRDKRALSNTNNPLISAEESRALAELAIRPNMLNLKDTNTTNEFEWDSDIGGEEINLDSGGSSNSESRTLLAQSTDAPIR